MTGRADTDAADGRPDHHGDSGCPSLRWSAEDDGPFRRALSSEGQVTAAQVALANEHATATGCAIGHSLVHVGAITQRQIMAMIERM